MIKLPFYTKPPHPVFPLARNTTLHITEVANFLKWVVESDELEIANYLPRMGDTSFFLVAATGLGKTVGVPVHVLLRQIQRTGQNPNPKPRVWVVEPRIPIATDQEKYMNHLWNTYRLNHSRSRQGTKPLFGCITSKGNIHRDAPIKFVTTGIFEMMASKGELDPINDRVIIDEAHVTVEQNPLVELGIALCRKAGVTVDYMSATVDVTGLGKALGVQKIIRADQERNIIWKSNLLKPIDEAIVDLVEGTLVSPDRNSIYYPTSDYPHADKVTTSALEAGRSHGMLIVVNSHNGSTSDTRKLTNKLRTNHPQIPVLHLASEIIRDPKLEVEFRNRLNRIEAHHQNYIIISTSVVEMGITFPTLDYVVTMDCGYDQETIGDTSFPVVAPLGVNSLLQRIGRVGRRRPGIAYISNEIGADYSSLEDEELNRGKLAYEPIRYPLKSAPLMPLAYYAIRHEHYDFDNWLADLQLPSNIQEDADRMEFFHEQLKKLDTLGISKEGRLTPLGEMMEQWIGRADIAYATQLQKRFSEGASREEILFWVVATSLSNTSANGLKAQYGHFVDYDGSHKETSNRIDIWSGSNHEDIAMFRAIAEVSDVMPGYLWNQPIRNQLNSANFYRWGSWAGIDARKCANAGKAIGETLKTFTSVNGKTTNFAAIFGSNNPLSTSKIDWMAMYNALPTQQIGEQLASLAGMTTIQLTYVESRNEYEWSDKQHDRSGLISQDDTPIKLNKLYKYTARVMPSRQTKGDEASWRLASLCAIDVPTSAPAPVIPKQYHTPVALPPPTHAPTIQQSHPKKKGLLSRMFDRLFE